jgi:hypothetical protein
MSSPELQTPSIQPRPNWIEIQWASAAVDYPTKVEPEVLDYFEEIIDPENIDNKWLAPLPGVILFDEPAEQVESNLYSWKIAYRCLLPDGRLAWLEFGDAQEFGEQALPNVNLAVRIRATNQPALPMPGVLEGVVKIAC